jgi:general secretion pathway protein D
VKNKEKAKVHIGDKVPVITTTTTATGFAAASVNYLEVGLKLEVEPNVFLENEVGMKVALEVSNIVREIQNAAGTLTYQVGTRNASTSLRLKDGETQILAGLINDEDRRVSNQIPGLGNLPVIGRLFGSRNERLTKTEVVLLITPRVIRSLARPEFRFEEFHSGTEAAMGSPPLLLQRVPEADAAGATPWPPLALAATERQARAATASVTLRGPDKTRTGSEFVVEVRVDADTGLRNGVFDVSFDASRMRFIGAEPGALVQASAPDAGFHANAPQGAGRATLSLAAKSDIKGTGELLRLKFQALEAGDSAPVVLLQALAITDASGRAVTAALPPPLSIAIAR